MKTKIKKTVKSVVLGVAVLGLAVGVSAFDSIGKTEELHIVNTPSQLRLINNYNSTNCLMLDTKTCAYKVLDPEALPDQSEFTEAEIADFLQEGWIEELPEKGVYQE